MKCHIDIANAKLTIEILEAPKNIQVEYAYYIFLDKVRMQIVSYQASKEYVMDISEYGTYSVQAFMRDKRKQELLAVANSNAVRHRLTDKVRAMADLPSEKDSLLHMVNAYEQEVSHAKNILSKLSMVNGFNVSICEFLKKQGYDTVSLYIDSDAVLLQSILNHGKNNFDGYISSQNTRYETSYYGIHLIILFERIESLKLGRGKNAVVIADSRNRSDTAKKIENIGAEALFIENVLDELMVFGTIILPFMRLKERNPSMQILFVNSPYVNDIVHKTEHEKHFQEKKQALDEFVKENKKLPAWDTLFAPYGYDAAAYEEMSAPFRVEKRSDGTQLLADIVGKYVNVVNGTRVTTDLKEKNQHRIYMYGHSVLFGMFSEDKYTIPSCMQRLLNESNISYNVINCANHWAAEYTKQMQLINKIQFKPQDIIISMISDKIVFALIKKFLPVCDLVEALQQRGESHADYFVNASHFNHIGNQIFAEAILAKLSALEYFADTSSDIHSVAFTARREETFFEIPAEIAGHPELGQYLDMLKTKKVLSHGRIGSIVMNCNPFTLGHRYLIEQAVKQVDHLYIFVVQEDSSEFPFAVRYDLVHQGVADLENVTVLPSGKFIISALTFEAYSNKDVLKDKTINPALDVEVFAQIIAPTLDIAVRFVGEEPFCNVTQQYKGISKNS